MSKIKTPADVEKHMPPKPKCGRRRAVIREETLRAQEEVRERITGRPTPPPEQSRVDRLSAKTYLQNILNDHEMPVPVRMKAAKELLPYEEPKLQSITIKGDPSNPLTTVNANTTVEELEAIAKRVLGDI